MILLIKPFHPEKIQFEDAKKVAKAWVEPGSHPDFHFDMMVKLRKDWPVLAQALDKLAQQD